MLRSIFVLILAGVIGCSGERMMTPEVTEIGQKPLTKPVVVGDVTQAMIIVRVHQDGVPVSGATVELSRSISARMADYMWSAITDRDGEARIFITSSDDVNGYYQARAVQDETTLGKWSSIPINTKYVVTIDLPIGGKMSLTSFSPIRPQSIVGSWRYTGSNFVQVVSKNLLNSLIAQGLPQSVAAEIVQEFVSDVDDDGESPAVRRFNKDGSFENQYDEMGVWSSKGMWSAEGNSLKMIESEGFIIECAYFVHGDNLTLSFSRDQFLQAFLQAFLQDFGLQPEDLDEESQRLFNEILTEEDTIQFFFEMG